MSKEAYTEQTITRCYVLELQVLNRLRRYGCLQKYSVSSSHTMALRTT